MDSHSYGPAEWRERERYGISGLPSVRLRTYGRPAAPADICTLSHI